MTVNKLPDDVYDDSGFRLPLPKRGDLDDAAAGIYDLLIDPNGGSLVGLRGPGGIRLHSPEVSVPMRAVNNYLRGDAGYSGRVRELAILVTAREMDSSFEWSAHEPAALKEGISPAIIDIVRHRKGADGLGETEAVIIRFGRELFGERRVSPETFASALRLFGRRDLVDLVSLMGQYAATAALLTAFDAQPSPDQERFLPLP